MHFGVINGDQVYCCLLTNHFDGFGNKDISTIFSYIVSSQIKPSRHCNFLVITHKKTVSLNSIAEHHGLVSIMEGFLR